MNYLLKSTRMLSILTKMLLCVVYISAAIFCDFYKQFLICINSKTIDHHCSMHYLIYNGLNDVPMSMSAYKYI